ncbi:ABC transporter permease subunit [Nakamurella sp. YIM 132087]|uniref:ABC transporter permease subunit n=1 Tax=Nakamurella alba TaxID=2665158 RepID=A0A7K1FFN9_9ACTN|nr:ABC transporter permease [Nakamurella alba]MTD12922.1 ABC transporter permease subunit [Nakamurella alba]
MLTFIVRRVIAAFFLTLGATVIAWFLVINSGDPLEAARGISDPTRRQTAINGITAALNLDVNPVARYFIWLKGVAGCFIGQCDFGTTTGLVPVTNALGSALLSSLRLVTAATVLAVVLGIAIGIISALRQYSGLDYTVTFLSFLFFSLPVFFIGVILKDLMALRFNTFLQDGAQYSWGWIIAIGAFMGLVAFSLIPGELRRRLAIGGAVGILFFVIMYVVTVTQWLLDPSLGIVGVAIISVLLGLGMTTLTSGLANKKSLYTSMTTVAVGIALWYPLQYFFYEGFDFLKLLLLLVVAIAVGMGIGYLYGGDDKGLSARNGGLTAFFTGLVIFIDRLLQAWKSYSENPAINGRPIRTTLPATPNLRGDFWIQTTDMLTHLILPTITLMLISLAGHSRFARSSMLEVMNQDYIRTARSKGLTERTVVMRHAFRNALIPMATVVAFDISGLIGGAVLTETVFGWKSMGSLFQTGLTQSDPNPVMAFFVVSALIAVLANLLADIAYAALDPRIRLS